MDHRRQGRGGAKGLRTGKSKCGALGTKSECNAEMDVARGKEAQWTNDKRPRNASVETKHQKEQAEKKNRSQAGQAEKRQRQEECQQIGGWLRKSATSSVQLFLLVTSAEIAS